jgi:hypothetical protein
MIGLKKGGKMLYTADFETTTDENDCRVWAYGVCEVVVPKILSMEIVLISF